MRRSEAGSALIIALVLSALVLAVLMRAMTQLEAQERFFTEELRGVSARGAEEHARIDGVVHALRPGRSCSDEHDSPLRLCAQRSPLATHETLARLDGSDPHARRSFPWFDFDGWLKGGDSCDTLVRAAPGVTLGGAPLSPLSAQSTLTCTIVVPRAPNVDVGEAAIGGSSITVARGYIAIGTLHLSGDAALISAGDLLIESIDAPADAHLTLVSTTGIVRVAASSPAVTFSAAGWLGVTLQPGSTISAHALPGILELYVTGFEEKRD